MMNSLALILASLSAMAAEPIGGHRQTDDGKSVVSIEICADDPDHLCGYLVQYQSTGDRKKDRVFRPLQLHGGLETKGGEFVDGWPFDPKEGEAYDLKLQESEAGNAIELRIYSGMEMMGETLRWTRHEAGAPGCKLLPPRTRTGNRPAKA